MYSKKTYGSLYLILYFAVCFVGIVLFALYETTKVLAVGHAVTALFLVVNLKRLLPVISSNRAIKEACFLFLLFLFWVCLTYIFHSAEYGLYRVLKPLFSFIGLNYALGLIIGLLILDQSMREKLDVRRFYTATLVILCLFCFYQTSVNSWQTDRLLLEIQVYGQSMYQTISFYLMRFYLVGVVLYTCSGLKSNRLFSILMVTSTLLFSVFSLVVGSKKEPIFFLIMFVFVVLKLRSRFKYVILAVAIVVALLLEFNNATNSEALGNVSTRMEKSLVIRMELLKDHVSQDWSSIVLGDPFISDRSGKSYVHSFIFSLISATGIIGLFLFSLFGCYLIYNLTNKRRYDIVVVIVVVFAMTNVATFFDWPGIWFVFGLGNAMLSDGKSKYLEHVVTCKDDRRGWKGSTYV